MRRVMLLFLMLAACSGGARSDEVEEATTTSTTATTTITTSSTTSTTAAGSCVDTLDDGRQTLLEPGCFYTHDQSTDTFAVSLGLEVVTAGWREAINSPRVLRFLGPEVEGFTAQLDILAMPSSVTIGSLIERLTSESRSDAPLDHTPPVVVELNGREVTTFDVFHGYDPDDEDPCGETIEAGDILIEDLSSGGWFGPELCTWTRVWLIDIDGTPLVILGLDDTVGTTRRNRALANEFPDARPILEDAWADLVNALTFCTEATPCDD